MKVLGLALMVTTACSSPDVVSISSSSGGGTGGTGGASVASSSASTGGGGMSGWGMPCVASTDCAALNDPLLPCWVVMCLHDVCDRVPLALGTACDEHDPAQVCNGLGACREVFEYGGACYVRPDMGFPEPCPTCDDGDPCTVDSCINDACENVPLPDGHMCGPWFTCQAGNCCPHPDTIPH